MFLRIATASSTFPLNQHANLVSVENKLKFNSIINIILDVDKTIHTGD